MIWTIIVVRQLLSFDSKSSIYNIKAIQIVIELRHLIVVTGNMYLKKVVYIWVSIACYRRTQVFATMTKVFENDFKNKQDSQRRSDNHFNKSQGTSQDHDYMIREKVSSIGNEVSKEQSVSKSAKALVSRVKRWRFDLQKKRFARRWKQKARY